MLSGAHERLQQRCARDKIVEVLEEHGAYADNALRSLLSRRFDVIEKQLSDCDAAPPAFLTLLAEHLGSSSVDGTAAGSSAAASSAGSSSGAAAAAGVLCELARTRGGVRPHRGFTENFTAPGGPHLGHHHLPSIPRCRHHAPGAYRPPSVHLPAWGGSSARSLVLRAISNSHKFHNLSSCGAP